MNIRIRAFGIAKDILRDKKLNLELENGQTIADVRRVLSDRYPDFTKLRSLAFALNESYVEDDQPLQNNDEVVIIPPVSGG